jgi:hypothetical protein
MGARRQDPVPRVSMKDAKPGRDVRPAVGLSDAPLSALGPLTIPGPGDQFGRPQPDRPQISGSPDAVIGAPLTPPRESSLELGADSAGGFTVPKELDGTPRKPRRRPS